MASAVGLQGAIVAGAFAVDPNRPIDFELISAVLFCEALLVLYAWVGWRYARSSLKITDGSVIVKNPFRTITVPLSEVDRFEGGGVSPSWTANPTPGIVLRLRDGTSIGVRGMASESWVWNADKRIADYDARANELNVLLSRA